MVSEAHRCVATTVLIVFCIIKISFSNTGEPQLSSDFSEMCECGQTCPTPDDGSSSVVNNTSPSITDMYATNTISFSNLSDHTLIPHEADTETNFTITTESNLEVLNVSNSTSDISANFVAGTMETSLNISKSEVSSSLRLSNNTTIQRNFTKTNVMDPNIPRQESTTHFVSHSIPNAIVSSSISKPYTYQRKTRFESPDKRSRQRLLMTSSVTSAVTEPSRPQQQVRSINKERQHIVSEVLSSALTTDQTSPPQHGGFEGSDKLFVLDRDTLWGMLREVVHVELDKKLPGPEDNLHRSENS